MTKFLTMITPSELVLLKVLALGFFFGWTSKRFMKPKTHEITNYKFDLKEKL